MRSGHLAKVLVKQKKEKRYPLYFAIKVGVLFVFFVFFLFVFLSFFVSFCRVSFLSFCRFVGSFVEKTVADSPSPRKCAALASAPLASFAGSPASGLLRRPAATAGQGLLVGEAPWPLCVSALNSYIF
jgi:hypothetical protein